MKAELRPVSAALAREFVAREHYSGTCGAGVVRHGWWVGEELVGVSVFDHGNHDMRQGVFGPEYARNVLHHHRLAVLSSWQGFTSQFLAASLRALPRDVLGVVTYADMAQGHSGTVYQATNALYTGVRTKGNIYFRVPDDGRIVTMQSLKRIGTWPERRAYAREQGWPELKSPGKHRYVFLRGPARRGQACTALARAALPVRYPVTHNTRRASAAGVAFVAVGTRRPRPKPCRTSAPCCRPRA